MATRLGKPRSDRAFNTVVVVLLAVIALLCLYPVLYTFSLAFSRPEAVRAREVWLFPVGLSLSSFRMIFQHDYILLSYRNTIMYTTMGTAYSMALTILAGYALSRRRLPGRNAIMFLIWFTMVFSGGLIPTYLVVNELGMINTIWAMVIPLAVAQWNLIVLRTHFMGVPESLEESARLDGADDFTILIRIILPVSIPVVSTISLFYVVAKWNDFFNALLYLNDKNKYPLQLILRELLVAMTDNTIEREVVSADKQRYLTPLGFRSAIVVVSLMPMLIAYPFIQRFFVHGIMIGSIKG